MGPRASTTSPREVYWNFGGIAILAARPACCPGLETGRGDVAIDESQILRSAVEAFFGRQHPAERCRHHNIQNAMGYLPVNGFVY